MNFYKRLVIYLLGLFIMTVGIAFSIKSNLGVSPVSTIPYTLTVVWGIEIGLATIIFHCFLVGLQIILLRRDFNLKDLLQIPVGIIFGYFTSFSVSLMNFIPPSDSLAVSLIYMAVSIVVIAFGIFLYVPPKLINLAGEGAMLAISKVTKIEFSKVKIAFDISMVTISFITCIFMIHSLGSVGIGTVISAVLVGTVLNGIIRIFNHFKKYNPIVDGF